MTQRFLTTAFIWLCSTGIIITTLITATSSYFSVLHLLTIAIIGGLTMGATSFIWDIKNGDPDEYAKGEAEKRKNEERLNRIISKLSDEERAALRDQLLEQSYALSDEGELVRR